MKKTPEFYLEKWQGKSIAAIMGSKGTCVLIVLDEARPIVNMQEVREIVAALCAKTPKGEITI